MGEHSIREAPAALRAFAAGLLAIAATAPATAADDFYKGKTLTLFVGSGPGGGYDLYGRLVARNLGRHLPGEPTIVAQNMPGAGSITAANHIYNRAPRDGTVLGIVSPSIALIDALQSDGVRFEAAKFNWIGRVAPVINVTFTMGTSRIKTAADAMREQSLIAGISASSPLSLNTRVMNAVVGAKFKQVVGYADSNATLLAAERGEVDGSTVSWSTLKTSRAAWLRDKKINVLVQYTIERAPDLEDVPSAVELARTPEERQIIALYVNGADVGYSIFTAPETPDDRVDTLRTAFMAMTRDKQFIEEAGKLGSELDPMPGERVQKLIADTLNITPEVREKAKKASATE
jgi:tripartite-type tricarboxylate transporter receptor subunit TctC